MIRAAAFRGQPLLLFGGVLTGWLALRIALWEPPFESAVAQAHLIPPGPAGFVAPPAESVRTAEDAVDRAVPIRSAEASTANGLRSTQPLLPPSWMPQPAPPPLLPPPVQPQVAPPLDPPHVAIAHSVLLVLGLSRMPLPEAFAAFLGERVPANGPPARRSLAARTIEAPKVVSHWSADGWLLLRHDGARGPILSDRPSYGRSQAGAVVRYSLALESPLRPQAHLRGAMALSGAREREAAAGLSLRPLPGAPLRVSAEARISEGGGGSRVRPAAYAVTEFPPLDLPLGLRGEVYLQAGYVGGEFDTAFADGQARAERPLAHAGGAEVSAGAGAWGGAQKDSARLDIGPTAAVTFRLGEARGRLAADYRFRIAGDAEPASGPALTVSAGF